SRCPVSSIDRPTGRLVGRPVGRSIVASACRACRGRRIIPAVKELAMSEIKDRYDHVIIGGGIAADAAARAIHQRAPEASIAIISADPHQPVYRPALSKDLWSGDDPDPDSQALHTAE